jgi:hypothetical protein
MNRILPLVLRVLRGQSRIASLDGLLAEPTLQSARLSNGERAAQEDH